MSITMRLWDCFDMDGQLVVSNGELREAIEESREQRGYLPEIFATFLIDMDNLEG